MFRIVFSVDTASWHNLDYQPCGYSIVPRDLSVHSSIILTLITTQIASQEFYAAHLNGLHQL